MHIRIWWFGALFFTVSVYATNQVGLVIPQLEKARIQEKQTKIVGEIARATLIRRGTIISGAAIATVLAYWYFYKSSYFASPYHSADELMRDFRNLPRWKQQVIVQAGAAQLDTSIHGVSWRSFFANLTVQAASGILSGIALKPAEPIIERFKAQIEEAVYPFFNTGTLEWYLNTHTNFYLIKDANNELIIDDTFIKSLELHIQNGSLELLIAATDILIQQVEGIIAFMQYRSTVSNQDFQDYIQKIINHLESAASIFTARLQELLLKSENIAAVQEQLSKCYTVFTQELVRDLLTFYAVGN